MNDPKTEERIAAVSKAPRVTRGSIDAKIRGVSYMRRRSMTLCVIELANGFQVIGKSAPVDPANFDEEIGKNLAYNDAYSQIWMLERYLLAEKLFLKRTESNSHESH